MRTIKTSTLESRFKKLHTIANYAEDCMRAIAMHTERLAKGNEDEVLAKCVVDYRTSLEEWCAELAKFASMCQQIEAQYYNHLIDNNSKCELIEEVPKSMGYTIPNPFQMSETMYKMGYYTLDEDFYGVKNKVFSNEEILADIEKLRAYATFCVKALPNMSYKGIWEPVGQKACEIHDQFCEGLSAKLQRAIATLGK